jgi:hypothetical protein
MFRGGSRLRRERAFGGRLVGSRLVYDRVLAMLRGGGIGVYAKNGFVPELVADFSTGRYWSDSAATDPLTLFAATTARTSNATMWHNGVLKWGPHTFLLKTDLNDADWAATSVTKSTSGDYVILTEDDTAAGSEHYIQDVISFVAGQTYTFGCDVKSNGRDISIRGSNGAIFGNVTMDLSNGSLLSSSNASLLSSEDLGDGWYRIRAQGDALSSGATNLRFELSDGADLTYDGDGTSGVFIRRPVLYRSDLGGMAPAPDGTDYVTNTTGAARYLPRYGHTNPKTGVRGVLIETDARTNLLLNSGTLSTQNVTVTAVQHVLSFTGTGTVTLSGTSTAGPLVGTGAGESNRVSLNFTPTAGALTLTVSGTVTNAQLEAVTASNPHPSSYIPTAGATVTRNADTNGLAIASSLLPWSGTAVCIAVSGEVSYGDDNAGAYPFIINWAVDASNYISHRINDESTRTGRVDFWHNNAGTFDVGSTGAEEYSPGANVAFTTAGRITPSEIQAAKDGTAGTVDATLTGLVDVSGAAMQIAPQFNGVVSQLIVWVEDIGEAGLEAASSNSFG